MYYSAFTRKILNSKTHELSEETTLYVNGNAGCWGNLAFSNARVAVTQIDYYIPPVNLTTVKDPISKAFGFKPEELVTKIVSVVLGKSFDYAVTKETGMANYEYKLSLFNLEEKSKRQTMYRLFILKEFFELQSYAVAPMLALGAAGFKFRKAFLLSLTLYTTSGLNGNRAGFRSSGSSPCNTHTKVGDYDRFVRFGTFFNKDCKDFWKEGGGYRTNDSGINRGNTQCRIQNSIYLDKDYESNPEKNNKKVTDLFAGKTMTLEEAAKVYLEYFN